MNCTEQLLRETIASKFDGTLSVGSHEPKSGQCCILEAYSACLGIRWSDKPHINRTWDIRPLNDIRVSDKLRLQWMPQVMAVYAGSLDWPTARQRQVVEKLVIMTVNRILPRLNFLSEVKKERCRRATDLAAAKAAALAVIEGPQATWATGEAAQSAARAAAWTARAGGVWGAAQAAAEVAQAAAEVAQAAAEVAQAATLEATRTATLEATRTAARVRVARRAIFTTVCQLWIEATCL